MAADRPHLQKDHPMTLTDTQLLLPPTSQREDLLLVPPANLKGKAASTATAKLLRGSLIKEMVVRPDEPHWRESEGNCIRYKLTLAGPQAIAIEPEEDGPKRMATDHAQVVHAPGRAGVQDSVSGVARWEHSGRLSPPVAS